MKGEKILATLIVLAMVLSGMMALNILDIKLVEDVSAGIPGVTDWGNGTADYVYHPTNLISVRINTSNLSQDQTYYIMYPYYKYSGGYNLSWRKAEAGGAPVTINESAVTATSTETISSPIVLNRSGFWFIAKKNLVDQGIQPSWLNLTNYSMGGFFWVNSSLNYSIEISSGGEIVTFGQNETVTVSVTDGTGSSPACWIDVVREITGAKIFHTYSPTGTITFDSDWINNLTRAGNYTVQAYKDIDATEHGYGEDAGYYNTSYGNSTSFAAAGWYKYSRIGPWDPPEYNATNKKIVVETGEPTATVKTANNTMYWNFDGRVEIEVHNYDGGNITNLRCSVWNSDDVNITANFTSTQIRITPTGKEAWILINSSNWGKNSTSGHVYGENGTWYAYIVGDLDGDHKNYANVDNHDLAEEWNVTAYWTVTSAPGAQFKWVDDDGNIGTDNNDGVLPRVPELNKQPVNISFQIIGRDHGYYGAGGTVATMGENITVSGDALFLSSQTLDKFPGAWFDGTSNWYINITPTMALNGGMITIACDWSGNGSVSEDLYIGGNMYNGTIVTISPTEFPIDQNVTITVTVTDPVSAGYGYANAEVYLYYVHDDNGSLVWGPSNSNGLISTKLGGGSTSGTYEFLFNTTMQKENQTSAYGSIKAPRNISAYVKLYRGTPSVTNGYIYGYALAKMKAITDLKVTCEPNEVMAGERISKLYLNTTTIDTVGNDTGWPEDSGLKVRIYNETGDDVTDLIGNIASGTGSKGTDGKANKTASNVYIQKPGTYTIYAYNNTHNSEGYNATLVVVPVDVTSSLKEIIWGVDKNVSTTLTVTYDGQPLNGTLRIDNVTAVGNSYNKTWTNCSFTPTIGSTSGTDTKNSSRQVTVTNGEYILYNITANNLSEWLKGAWQHYSKQNITFYFKPKTSGSAWARATGMIPVRIANVKAKPASIPYNKPAEVELTVTGRDIGLENVWVSMIIPGLTGELNTTTDADGKALFAFTPPTTGTIEIRIENRTSEVTIPVTSWSLYLDVDSQANEGIDFTVTVRNATAAGAALADAAVTFNRETKTTDSSGQVTFSAPTVTVAREYTITATKDGYAEASEDILILNIPKLIIVVVGEVAAGSTFDVVIADDAGNAVVGATITINQDVYTTGAQGIATITAPSEEGTYTITATFPGYTDADPISITIEAGGIPGFELLTLIAALGVAFILFRRRRRN